MGAFLSYSIVSGLIFLSLFLAYRIFLAAENQHAYNRAVILGIYVVAFSTLPIISLIQSFASTPQATVMIESIEVAEVMTSPTSSKPIWGTILIWAFMLGMIVVTIRTIATWVKLASIIRKGEKIVKEGHTIVVTDDSSIAPFSWLHYVVLYRGDYEDDCSAIIDHELKHVASRHWVDLLIAQAACIVNWFNPAAWLMRDELMLVHEYQADMAVINAGHNAQEYQMLLIKKAVGSRFQSLANSLNHSKLKKRITMMYQKKSSTGRKFKALALVPMLALALAATTVSPVRAAITTISDSETMLSNSNAPSAAPHTDDATKASNTETPAEDVLLQAEVMPQYPGGMSAMMQAVMSKCKFPNADKEWDEGVDGKAVVQFTVYSDGQPGDFKLLKSTGDEELDQSALNAAKEGLVERWTPAMDKGKPVAVKYVIPIVFQPTKENDKQQIITISNKSRVESTESNMAVSFDSEKGGPIIEGAGTDLSKVNIYINEQKSTYEQMQALDANSIVSISIDKATNSVHITTRK